jgi:hypothetical protein
MRRLAAFLTRAIVFALLGCVQHSLFSNKQSLQDLDTRIILSSMQIFLVSCFLCLYFTCRWMFAIMHINTPYRNVQMSTDDTPSLHGETASQVSQGLVAQQVVIFADRDALSRHVMRVYIVGFMLHATVFCFNYTLTAVLFHTSTGAVLGYLTRALQYTRHTTLTLLFACTFTVVVVLTYIDLESRDLMVHDFRDVVTGIVLPIVVGFAWTSGFCFGESNRYCVEMSTEAFPVCCLCVVPVMWATPFDVWESTFAYFDTTSLLVLLLVEPVAKFMSIYVLMISLQTQNVLDIVLVLCAVAQAEVLMDEFSPFTVSWSATTRLVLVSLLLAIRTINYCYIDISHLCNNRSHAISSPEDPFADEHKSPNTPVPELDAVPEHEYRV